MSRRLPLCFAVAMLAIAGCGSAKPVATPETAVSAPVKPQAATPTEHAGKPPAATTTETPLVATADEGTAEAAFQQTLIAFQDGRLDAAFDFLPTSFQTDIENIVHEFAEKVDAELWTRSFELMTKFAKILKTKKSLIFSLNNVKRIPQFDSIKPHWDTIVSRILDVTTSEVSDVKRLKSCDLKKMIASASRLLDGMPLPKFGDVTVTTVSADSEKATLAFRDSKEGEMKQVEFVKIDGKWLPKSIAAGWPESISTIRLKLAELPEQIASMKPILMQQFDGLNGILDQLQQAKTSEEFNASMMPLVLAISLGHGLAEQAFREAESISRKGNALHLIVNRELTDAEQTKLRDAVRKAVNDSTIEDEIIANDGKTRFRFVPISDRNVVITLLKSHFEGAAIQEDPETKTIRVEMK